MSFWKNKRVFITGHTGFKGSWLSLWLQSLGAEVTGYALKPATVPSLFDLAAVGDNMRSHIADVRDASALIQAVMECKPDIVFHMAAQPLVRYSYAYPVETYATNVMGTVHLFEAVKAMDTIKVVVNITTDKCYENKDDGRDFVEQDKLGGHDPYSSSKACAELVSSAYRDSYFRDAGVGLATARAGNVIGGGDWSLDRLIPDIIRGCLGKKPVMIRNPGALRPWQHVLDPLHGYMQLAKYLFNDPARYSESWNFGPCIDDIKPVGWIADYITQQWGGQNSWLQDAALHPHEAASLKLDCAKAASRLGWQPLLNLQQGLDETMAWYRAHTANKDMREVTMNQINHFSHLKLKREVAHVEAAIY